MHADEIIEDAAVVISSWNCGKAGNIFLIIFFDLNLLKVNKKSSIF